MENIWNRGQIYYYLCDVYVLLVLLHYIVEHDSTWEKHTQSEAELKCRHIFEKKRGKDLNHMHHAFIRE